MERNVGMTTNILTAIVTAYCSCKICCGPTAPKPTANNSWPIEGITIAGPRKFQFNSLVKIEGLDNTFQLQDRLSKKYDDRFDIYFKDHADALKWGKQTRTVTVITP